MSRKAFQSLSNRSLVVGIKRSQPINIEEDSDEKEIKLIKIRKIEKWYVTQCFESESELNKNLDEPGWTWKASCKSDSSSNVVAERTVLAAHANAC